MSRSNTTKVSRGLVVLGILLFASFVLPSSARSNTKSTDNAATSITLGDQSKISIVLGKGASDDDRFAASELTRYLQELSGATINVISEAHLASRPSDEPVILLGSPTANSTVQRLEKPMGLDFSGLKSEGFFIKTGQFQHHPLLTVGGNDGLSTTYGVYELVHCLGVVYRLTGDIIPERKHPLLIPSLEMRQEPAFPRRGFLIPQNYENQTLFSYDDYAKLIDQMVKMKCNYMQFWWFEYAPFLKYSFRGEAKTLGDVTTKESAYLNWSYPGFGSRTTDDVSFGREHFKGRKLAPPEMQNVETPDQAFDAAETLLHHIIQYANKRGIKVWLAIEMANLPLNLARYTQQVGDLPFNTAYGAYVHPLDEVNREIQVNRLRALIETYPDVEGYFLVFNEAYFQLNSDKYRNFFSENRPKFFDLRPARWPWLIDIAQDTDRVVDSNIGYFDLFQYLLKARDQIAPKAKIGLMAIGRGYALPTFDKLLPRDIPFSDMESSGVWTPMGIPMEDFGGMGTRERTLEPRIDDDFDMAGMQFSVKQYEKDRIIRDGLKYGMTGFAGQVQRARGTETNSLFLTEAAWSPDLTAEEFYKQYSTRVFGERAAPHMYKAFMELEEKQAYLGYDNYDFTTMNCCGPLPEVETAHQYALQENAYAGPTIPNWKPFIVHSPDIINRFEGAIRLLNQALDEMREASTLVAPQGQYELKYLTNRTLFYRDYMQSMITIRQAYLQFDQAFRDHREVPDEQFKTELEKSLAGFEAANQQVQSATREYAEIVDHPADLGVLYQLNARAVLGFDLVRQSMQNIVNFYTGKSYAHHVSWERLYPNEFHFALAGYP
jgi:Glycosyl hydrolase family 67 N-terminus